MCVSKPRYQFFLEILHEFSCSLTAPRNALFCKKAHWEPVFQGFWIAGRAGEVYAGALLCTLFWDQQVAVRQLKFGKVFLGKEVGE